MNTKLKKARKVLCFIITLIFLTATFIPLLSPVSNASVGDVASPLRILEIQPSTASDITDSIKTDLKDYLGRDLEITTMPMSLFISKVADINGYYDIVYIGNNQTGVDPYKAVYNGNSYSRFGPKVDNNPNLAASVLNNREFYSGNDISNLSANKIKNYIASGQLAIFDTGIFSNNTTKLFSNFNSYRTGFYNVKTGLAVNLLDNLKVYKNIGIHKRPLLNVTQCPLRYDGTNTVDNTGPLSFSMDLRNNNSSQPMTVKLFIDTNGDGIFKEETELAQKYENAVNTNISLNHLLSKNFTGLIPWKLEVIDNFGVKSYETGFTALKGAVRDIRVLQLLPNRDTVNLKLHTLGDELLKREDEYNITITEMKIGDFNNSYINGSKKVNGVTTLVDGRYTTKDGVTTILNSNYDMVIFGFNDSYDGDLSGSALDAMKEFADSKQSIMFTHDTIGFNNNNLTRRFKDMLGMNAFATDTAKPSGITVSTGMTRLALYNSNGMNHFPDTVLTHKINESYLTKYPFILEDIRVSPTHLQYLRLNAEDPEIVTAFTYKNENVYNHGSGIATLVTPTRLENLYHDYDGFNDYYTFFRGNLTFSGTGHSVINSLDEKEMFVNTMLRASAGSNQAPTVQILGINENQNIANTVSNIGFSVKASDYEDRNVKGKIYVDSNDDGNYNEAPVKVYDGTNTLQCDIAEAVSIANVNASTRFGIKVVVTDSDGAEGYAEIHINNKSNPTLTVGHTQVNCLVGDTVNMDLTVSANGTGLNTQYKELELTMGLNNSAFSTQTAISGSFDSTGIYKRSLSTVNFTPNPDITSQTDAISFTCKTKTEDGFYTTASLSYKEGTTPKTPVTGNVWIDVDEGQVSVVLQDIYGTVINDQAVTLKKYTDAACTVQDTFFSPRTASTVNGVASFNTVPTGYYAATTILPTGYGCEVEETKADGTIGTTVLTSGAVLSKEGDHKLEFGQSQSTMLITLPKIYLLPPTIAIVGNNLMGIWSKQDLKANITIIDDTKFTCSGDVTWSVSSGGGGAVIANKLIPKIDVVTGKVVKDVSGKDEFVVVKGTAVLTAKKLGDVKVTASAIVEDLNGNEITIHEDFVVTINNVKVDIN